jgi:hypothetical protein
MKAIDPRQIHQKDLVAILQLCLAHPVLNSNAREIGDLLAQAGQAVK